MITYSGTPTLDAAQPDPTAEIPAPKHNSGNWLTHLLPTGGALAGGAGGAAIGTMLLPGIGTVAGGILGAALGGGSGKAVENATEDKGLLDDTGTAAIEGGVGQAAGGVLGKVIGKGAEVLGNRAAKVATNQNLQKEAEDLLEKHASVYGDISKKTQENLNVRDALKHVQDLGYDVGDPQNLVHVANNSTDVINDLLNKTLAKAGPVDASDYNDIIKAALADRGGTLGSYEKVALSRGRLGNADTPSSKLLQQLEDLGAGVAKKDADPNEIRTLITKIGKLQANAKPARNAEGVIDPVKQDLYDVHGDVYKALKSKLYDRPEVNDVIKGEVGNLVPDESIGITKELADHLNDVITKAGTGNNPAAQDLLDELSKNIDIQKLGKEATSKGQIINSKAGKARTAEELGLGNEGLNTNPVAQVLDATAGNKSLPERALSAAVHVKDNPKILDTLSRIGDLGAKIAPPAGVIAATAPNMAADPVPAPGGTPGMPGVGPGMDGGTMGGNMNNPVNLLPGGGGQSDYLNMSRILSLADPIHYGGVAPSIMALTPEIQKNQMAGAQMAGNPSLYGNAGGAQGLAGILSQITSLIPGTAAHTYTAQQQALAKQLGIDPALLPGLMQNQNTSDISQGILGNLRGQLVY